MVVFETVIVIAVLFLPVAAYLAAWALSATSVLLPRPLSKAKEILLVVAHPDDECFSISPAGLTLLALFFAPCLLRTLWSGGAQWSVLVLSAGNYCGLGEIRRNEFFNACKTLGMNRPGRCVVLDHKALQDNPHIWWDPVLIGEIVEDYVKNWNIDAIVTFDDHGITGHINHRATAAGVRHFALKSAPTFPAYHVVTKGKYTVLLDFPILLFSLIVQSIFNIIYNDELGAWGLLVASPTMYFNALRAFEHHSSQAKWNRYEEMAVRALTAGGITKRSFDTCTRMR